MMQLLSSDLIYFSLLLLILIYGELQCFLLTKSILLSYLPGCFCRICQGDILGIVKHCHFWVMTCFY